MVIIDTAMGFGGMRHIWTQGLLTLVSFGMMNSCDPVLTTIFGGHDHRVSRPTKSAFNTLNSILLR